MCEINQERRQSNKKDKGLKSWEGGGVGFKVPQ